MLPILALMVAATTTQAADDATRIVAHRGASAYLPEHTAAAYVLGYGQGADFLEPDLVVSADGELVARHDLTLESTTDVATVFPGRARADGRFYALDFTRAELYKLNAGARTGPAGGRFGLVTFDELVELTRQLNRSTGRRVGLYPELKAPAWHREHGHDSVAALIEALDRQGLPDPALPVMIQCFEPEPLMRLRARYGDGFALIRLLDAHDPEITGARSDAPGALADVAEYADGIGVPLDTLVEIRVDGRLRKTALTGIARELGLAVHPYTFRREGLPDGVELEALLEFFIHELAVDALFTDHPDVAVRVRR